MKYRLLVVLLAAVSPLQALTWDNPAGNSRLSLDTTLSYGVAVRTQQRDPNVIGITNGGHSGNINGDDGDLNYHKGKATSSVVKVNQEMDASFQKVGFFTRYTWFYDFANYNRPGLGPQAHNRAGSDIELLDLYARGETDITGQTTRLRVGRQVVNWGESTFIPGGISVINPVDLQKLHVPGAEVKEALMPTPMLWMSQGITKSVSVEGFALSDFNRVRTDPRGTFFSTDDALSDDGNFLYAGGGRRVDQHNPPGTFNLINSAGQTAAVFAPRAADRNAPDNGEYGMAARYYASQLNNTEFSFYFENYHSRTPIMSAHRGGATVGASQLSPPYPPGTCPGFAPYINFGGLMTGGSPCTNVAANYFVEYPQNIKLYGFGFSTKGPWGIAIQGENSYRPNMPVQFTPGEVLLSAGGLATYITGAGNNAAANSVPNGTEISGYRRMAVNQSQVSLTKLLGPQAWSDQTSLVSEVGWVHMAIPAGQFFYGPGSSLAPGTNTGVSPTGFATGGEGFATKDSWGYRILSKLDYFNILGQFNVSPRVGFSHDVQGQSATFTEGVKSVSLGVLTMHSRQISLDLAYTMFFGGRTFVSTSSTPVPPGQPAETVTTTNSLKDRDFVQATLSYSF